MSRDYSQQLNKCKSILTKHYLERSILDEGLTVIDYDPLLHAKMKFLELGEWIELKEELLDDPQVNLDLVFHQIADSIALGEVKYLVDTIYNHLNIKLEYMKQLTYNSFIDIIRTEFKESNPSLILAPLSFFKEMHLEWQTKEIIFGSRRGKYTINLPHYMYKPALVWSNKYVPFDSFVIVSKKFGKWIAQPNGKDRVRLDLRRETGKLLLHIYSTFNFSIQDPEEILRIDVEPRDGL